MIPSVQYPVLKVPACGALPRGFRSSAFVLGARLNNTRPPGPCPELFCDRRHLHILHTYGVREGSEGGFRPSLYMDGPRRPAQGTLHCASASRGGGRRSARHAGGRGALPDMAALAAAGPRALGSMRRMPAKRFAASRSASLRLHGLYIDASRSNPRTLSAPLWRIGRLRGFRTESVSQAIATSRGGEGERIRRRTEGPARFPHSRYAFSSTASRTQRDIRLDTARLHGSEHRRLREPFSPMRTK